MNEWYKVTSNDESVSIEFQQLADRFWPPEVMRDYPLQVGNVAGRRVVLTGRGAVWMYAHAAAQLQLAGAAAIAPQSQIAGVSDDLSGCECRLTPDKGDAALLSVHLRKSPPVSDTAVERLLAPKIEEIKQRGLRELCITGRAGNKVYASAAWSAAKVGVRFISCLSARDGLVVVATDDRRFGSASELPQWLADAMPSPKAPVVIGVVGDPNHGKSVFSAALDRYRTSKNQDGWILDCDGQAPTPHWYLSMLEQNNPEAIQLREQSKRPWTSEMEERIAKQICMGRRIFEILIADLPGGNHKASPPQRVPPGRERIFNEVDALILLENIDGQREAAWREALLRHGLDGRIAAVLTSRDPQVAPALSVRQNGDLWRGAIEGLDRNRPDGELDEAFRAGLDQLWPALLDFARRRPARG